jgi:lysophospholipase L1-like esterase
MRFLKYILVALVLLAGNSFTGSEAHSQILSRSTVKAALGNPGYGIAKRPAPAGSHFVIKIGQSNVGMNESTSNLQSDLLASISANYIYSINSSPPGWEVMTTSNNEGDVANTHTNTFGTEFRLMKLLHDNYGGSQYLVKYGKSSTQIASSGDATQDWNTSSAGELFDLLCYNYVFWNDKIPENVTAGWLIIQIGENDSANGTNSTNFQTNVTSIISTFRSRTGLGTALKVILVSLSTGQTSLNGTNRSTINTGMSNTASGGTNIFYLSQNEATSDGTHYTATGYDNIAIAEYNLIAAH